MKSMSNKLYSATTFLDAIDRSRLTKLTELTYSIDGS